MENTNVEAIRVAVNKQLKEQVELNAEEVLKIVDELVSPYIKEIDEYILKVKDALAVPDENLSDEELNKVLLVMSANLYTISDTQERFGIKQDIAEILADEKYDGFFSAATGTVADKNSKARDGAKEDLLIKTIYSRVYKLIKMKYESGNKFADAVKKVISNRLAQRA